MNNYELLCLISSKIEEEQILPIIENVEKIISELKGVVVYKKNLGKIKLAYSIKHERKAYFIDFYFNFLPNELKRLEEKLKNISEVIRYQITKIKKIPEQPLKEEKISQKNNLKI